MIAKDKLLHLVAGMLIAIGIGFLFSPITGFLLGTSAGALKEVYDAYQNRKALKADKEPPHGVELEDFIFTFVGSGIGAALLTFFSAQLGI
jgi:uncharacterized protein involved in cysteine biosynthesis